MAQSITIRNIPDALAKRLKARANRNHRSLQGELLLILEQASGDHSVREPDPKYSTATLRPGSSLSGRSDGEVPSDDAVDRRTLTITELWERGKRLGLSSPNESAEIVRKLRDERYGR